LKGGDVPEGAVRKVQEMDVIAASLKMVWWDDVRGAAHRWMVMLMVRGMLRRETDLIRPDSHGQEESLVKGGRSDMIVEILE
jgi:hypothetical protein